MDDVPGRILLIEDNPGDARLIEEMLSDAGGRLFHLVRVERLSAGLERLFTFSLLPRPASYSIMGSWVIFVLALENASMRKRFCTLFTHEPIC